MPDKKRKTPRGKNLPRKLHFREGTASSFQEEQRGANNREGTCHKRLLTSKKGGRKTPYEYAIIAIILRQQDIKKKDQEKEEKEGNRYPPGDKKCQKRHSKKENGVVGDQRSAQVNGDKKSEWPSHCEGMGRWSTASGRYDLRHYALREDMATRENMTARH